MIGGYCDEKFSSARELFEKNLKLGDLKKFKSEKNPIKKIKNRNILKI